MFVTELFVDVLACRATRSYRAFCGSRSVLKSTWGKSSPVIRQPMPAQDGFTITEVIATISLMGILLAMSVTGLTYYLSNKSVETAATELTAQIREAQSLAVSTGNTYRIDFSDSSLHKYTLQRRSGSQWEDVRSAKSLPSGVFFNAASLPSFGDEPLYLEFYARGNTESGQLAVVGRFGEARDLTVDGETANVR